MCRRQFRHVHPARRFNQMATANLARLRFAGTRLPWSEADPRSEHQQRSRCWQRILKPSFPRQETIVRNGLGLPLQLHVSARCLGSETCLRFSSNGSARYGRVPAASGSISGRFSLGISFNFKVAQADSNQSVELPGVQIDAGTKMQTKGSEILARSGDIWRRQAASKRIELFRF